MDDSIFAGRYNESVTGGSFVSHSFATSQARPEGSGLLRLSVRPPVTARRNWNAVVRIQFNAVLARESRWRNRSEFPHGRAEIVAFLERKWTRELDYRLSKDLRAHECSRIAGRFAYEWRDDAGNWFRSYGNENWEFDQHGLMAVRHASITDHRLRRAIVCSAGRRGAAPMITSG